jgi:hypothetical protein
MKYYFLQPCFVCQMAICLNHKKKPISRISYVFILTDQRWDALSLRGNPYVNTRRWTSWGKEFSLKNSIVTTPIYCRLVEPLFVSESEQATAMISKQRLRKRVCRKPTHVYSKRWLSHRFFLESWGKNTVGKPVWRNWRLRPNNSYPDRRGYYYKTIGKIPFT